MPLLRSLSLSLLLAVTVGAQEAPASPDVDRQARELFHTLMSPYCPGSLLASCPSANAAVLRDSVRARLQRGQSPERIREHLVSVYGPEILAAPPFEGLGLFTWIGAAVLGGGGLLLALQWMRHRPRETAAKVSVDPAEVERVRRELASHDGA